MKPLPKPEGLEFDLEPSRTLWRSFSPNLMTLIGGLGDWGIGGLGDWGIGGLGDWGIGGLGDWRIRGSVCLVLKKPYS
jgi:hypothetical protein